MEWFWKKISMATKYYSKYNTTKKGKGRKRTRKEKRIKTNTCQWYEQLPWLVKNKWKSKWQLSLSLSLCYSLSSHHSFFSPSKHSLFQIQIPKTSFPHPHPILFNHAFSFSLPLLLFLHTRITLPQSHPRIPSFQIIS